MMWPQICVRGFGVEAIELKFEKTPRGLFLCSRPSLKVTQIKHTQSTVSIYQNFIRKTSQRRMPEWWGQSSRMSCNQRVKRGWIILSTVIQKLMCFDMIFKWYSNKSRVETLVSFSLKILHFSILGWRISYTYSDGHIFIVEKSRDNSQEVNWDLENKKRYTHISERKARSLQMGSPSTQGYWCQYRERSNVAPAIFSTNDMNGYKFPLLKIMWCSYVPRPYYRLQK